MTALEQALIDDLRERVSALEKYHVHDAYWLRILSGMAMQGMLANERAVNWQDQHVISDAVKNAQCLLEKIHRVEAEGKNENV